MNQRVYVHMTLLTNEKLYDLDFGEIKRLDVDIVVVHMCMCCLPAIGKIETYRMTLPFTTSTWAIFR